MRNIQTIARQTSSPEVLQKHNVALQRSDWPYKTNLRSLDAEIQSPGFSRVTTSVTLPVVKSRYLRAEFRTDLSGQKKIPLSTSAQSLHCCRWIRGETGLSSPPDDGTLQMSGSDGVLA